MVVPLAEEVHLMDLVDLVVLVVVDRIILVLVVLRQIILDQHNKVSLVEHQIIQADHLMEQVVAVVLVEQVELPPIHYQELVVLEGKYHLHLEIQCLLLDHLVAE
tara:strand:+ start:173 stop:487 length:315 start_codon:yes stop_codon:yes gene_type:complete